MIETVTTFFASRADWLKVGVMENDDGDGYEVVLRIDGTYLEEMDAVVNAALFHQRLANLGLIREEM